MVTNNKCEKCGAELQSFLKDDHWTWVCGSGFYLPSRTFVQSLECKDRQLSKSMFFNSRYVGNLGLLVKDCQTSSDKFHFPDVDMLIIPNETIDRKHYARWGSTLLELAKILNLNIVLVVNLGDKKSDYSKSFTYIATVVASEESEGVLKVTKDRYSYPGRIIYV